jgi:hypothetical protein
MIWAHSLSLRSKPCDRATSRRRCSLAVDCLVRAVSFSSARVPLRELRVGCGDRRPSQAASPRLQAASEAGCLKSLPVAGRRLRCERPDQACENEPEKLDHSVSLRDSLRSSTEMRFSVHTGTIHIPAKIMLDS